MIYIHFRAIEAAAGISGAQLWALIEVRDHPGLTVSDVARRLSVHLSTASNLLDKLESRSLVKRTRNLRDQRIVQIHLALVDEKARVIGVEQVIDALPQDLSWQRL